MGISVDARRWCSWVMNLIHSHIFIDSRHGNKSIYLSTCDLERYRIAKIHLIFFSPISNMNEKWKKLCSTANTKSFDVWICKYLTKFNSYTDISRHLDILPNRHATQNIPTNDDCSLYQPARRPTGQLTTKRYYRHGHRVPFVRLTTKLFLS